jgi:hypothetical protein
MKIRRARRLFCLGLLLSIGCDPNPEGPHVRAQPGADTGKAAPKDAPLPKKGPDNPRGLQYAKPD